MVGLSVLALLGLAPLVAVTSPTPTQSPSGEFGQLLQQRYGAAAGVWSCAPPRGRTTVACIGEWRSGTRSWHQAGAARTTRGGQSSFMGLQVYSWTRRWSTYSRKVLKWGLKPYPRGVASVNGPASVFTWSEVARCASRLTTGQAISCTSVDNARLNGAGQFYRFQCSLREQGRIVCANSLGDAMRYRPLGN